jgi:hypothetical protein
MKSYQHYIDEFKAFSQSAIENNKPIGDQTLQQGTFSRMQSFISDFGDKIQKLNNVLVDKANEFLSEVSNDKTIDAAKLKNELFDIGKQGINTFISKYKPK